MSNQFLTTQGRAYSWNFFLSEVKRRDGRKDSRYFGFLPEPVKYLSHEESTYSDHYGPKTNFPAEVEGPISTALSCRRSKHLVSTTQYDYGGRRIGIFTGSTFPDETCKCNPLLNEEVGKEKSSFDDPEEILTTVGPVPLVKRCRHVQKWETTYQRDYVYDPIPRPVYPLP